MTLTEEQMEYKIPIVKEGSKHFFSTNSAKDWDFQLYFESTHNNISKFKHIAQIQRDFDNDLHWITQLEEVPNTIKNYARALINKNKPSKAILKANMAKHTSKRRKMTVNFNGPINGGTINNISNSNVHFSNEQNLKRKNEAEEDNVNEELKQRQDVVKVEPVVPSVWLDFSHYIQSHAEAFHPYSLEANKIIRSGKGVSPKPYLDRGLYNKHMESRDTKANPMPQSFHQYIDEYIDSVDLTMAKKKIKPLSLLLAMDKEDENDTANLEFLHQLLNQIHKTYASHVDYSSTEDAFNQIFIWPYLDVVAASVKIDGCNSDFVQGQPVLESMTKQLKAANLYVDDKNQYKSDGLVKLFGLNNLELVLLETSGCFINRDKRKVKFDHHKGVYGALAMLKYIVDDYSYASLETFTKVKVFFLHAADAELHFWSVCYQKDGMFDLWREANLKIKPDFGDKCDLVPELIQFCWEIKCILEESIKNIVALKQEHISIKSKYRYNPLKPVLLSNTINPIILKLTKEEDCSGMANLGPIYSPPHP